MKKNTELIVFFNIRGKKGGKKDCLLNIDPKNTNWKWSSQWNKMILPQDKRPWSTLNVSGSGHIKGFQISKQLMTKQGKPL